MRVYDKDYITCFTLICFGEDPFSVPLEAKLAARSIQVGCYVHVQSHTFIRMSQRNLLLLLRALSDISVTVTRSAALFFVPAALRSSPVQLSVKSVPFLFWIYSNEWLLTLSSLAVWGSQDLVPSSLLNDRRPRMCNIYFADKQCKEYCWHQTWIHLWPIYIHTYSGREQVSYTVQIPLLA